MSIEEVAWALAPGTKQMTRPVRLVEELMNLGLIGADPVFRSHGRTRPAANGKVTHAGALFPRLSDDPSAVLSPVFQWTARSRVSWFDAYDDWSIAPDINPVHRKLSAVTYRRARNMIPLERITVNSPYMAARLNIPDERIIPNGVDERLGSIETTGDDRRRLIVLGHFFPGRTDFRLIHEVALMGRFEEVVVAGATSDKATTELISELRSSLGSGLVEIPWLNMVELARVVGSRTVGILPHVVSDYTLSQDPMKLYQYLALGLRVICPSQLWPEWLPNAHAFLTGFGDNRATALFDWLTFTEPPSKEFRASFVAEHSWSTRATRLIELLEPSY